MLSDRHTDLRHEVRRKPSRISANSWVAEVQPSRRPHPRHDACPRWRRHRVGSHERMNRYGGMTIDSNGILVAKADSFGVARILADAGGLQSLVLTIDIVRDKFAASSGRAGLC